MTQFGSDTGWTPEKPWRFVGLETHDALLQRMVVLTTVAVDRSGRKADRPVEEVLGCGFITSIVTDRKTQQKLRIVCTAAHLLSEAEKHLRPDAAQRYSSPFGPEPLSILGKDIWRIHAHSLRDDRGQLASQALSASVFMKADLACLVMTHPQQAEKNFPLMLIDSDPLSPGTIVTMVGAPHARLRAEADEGSRTRVSMVPGWDARVGTITSVLPRSRLTGTPVYETNIPAPGAMSGGPVLLTYLKDDNLQIENVAIGVLSHDLPGEENRPDDVSIRGFSYVVPAMLIHALLVPPYLTKGAKAPLGKAKLVKDVGTRAAEIEVQLEPTYTIRRVRPK